MISGNEAQNSGGGIYCFDSDAMLFSCVIINNRLARLGSSGGGIYCYSGNPTIANCLIKKNVAPYLGGGVSCDSSSPVITGCTITENTSDAAGGGIRCSYDSNPVIQDCVIAQNVAEGGYDEYAVQGGGGIYCYESSPTIVNSVISDNRAVATGGGVVVSGYWQNTMPTFVHCVISGNSADAGGGIMTSGFPTVVNSVVRGNAPEQVVVSGDEIVITYSNVAGGWPGEGNIDAPPIFAFGDDWRILSGSACIDAGTNELPGGMMWEDIDGNARPIDGDGDGTPVADIGIHEFTGDMPSIALSTRDIEFLVHVDEPIAPDQTLLIRNCGGVALNWEIDPPCSWLGADPPSGESSGEIDEVVVSVDASGLSHGNYVCDLSIVDPDAANNPQTVHVVLHVATTLAVPSEYPTIGAAMDSATVAGDVVLVADGVYTGVDNKNLDFRGRAITVRSENGPWNCIIDCAGGGRAFNFDSGESETSVVHGFTITGGYEAFGAAIRCYGYCRPTISNCMIIGNRTIPSDPGGRGGGIFCRYHASPMITNCAFIGNWAESGGGIYASHESSPMITNCTITANTEGSGIYLQDSYAIVTNCIVRGNTPGQFDGAGYDDDLIVGYSNIQGGWEGAGNVDLDPLFALADDPHLLMGSPCTDTATNDPPGGLPSTDLDGNPRPIDGDADGVAVADMGACEFNPGQPVIAVSPPILEFYAAEGQTGSLEQTLLIRNPGGGVLNWNVEAQDPRVTVDPPDGVSTGEIDEVGVTVNIEGLTHGCSRYQLLVFDPQVAGSLRVVFVHVRVSATLRVPTEYSAIQDAIDAATEPGDVVLVANGVYTGARNKELDFRGGAITVCSENGPENCVIDCEGEGTAFVFQGHEGAGTVVRGFTIANGQGYEGGGIHCRDSSSPTIIDCTITGNTGYYGAGIYCRDNSNPTITGCTITGNAGGEGAGVYCGLGSSPTVTDCAITDNTASLYGAGIHCHRQSSATITGCTITDNTASVSGGGIYCYHCNPTIANCTITGNTATDADSLGGGICYKRGSTAVAANCILWANSAIQGSQIGMQGRSQSEEYPTLAVMHCDVEGGQAGVYVGEGSTLIWGNGNIDADPLFVDPNAADYHLSTGSPCIDAGCNCAVPVDFADLDGDGDTDEYLPFDLDGEGRFFDDPNTPDTGSGLPPIVDMGAYEFGGSDLPPCRGDLDGDRDVDVADLAVLLGHYGMTSGANGADGDMDCDGDIELSDLADFLGTYGDVCE